MCIRDSYKTFANNSVSDVGRYWYRFFNPQGVDRTNYAPPPYQGLSFGATSFTYNDGTSALAIVPTPSGLSLIHI